MTLTFVWDLGFGLGVSGLSMVPGRWYVMCACYLLAGRFVELCGLWALLGWGCLEGRETGTDGTGELSSFAAAAAATAAIVHWLWVWIWMRI